MIFFLHLLDFMVSDNSRTYLVEGGVDMDVRTLPIRRILFYLIKLQTCSRSARNNHS